LTGVLFECLTGQVPFLRPNEAATLHAHVLQPPPKISELRPDLPLELDDVIAHGMAKDPAARPATAAELIMEAQRALGSWSPHKDSQVYPAPGAVSPDRDQATRVRTRPPR
jgi:serine/threonine protein kinase